MADDKPDIWKVDPARIDPPQPQVTDDKPDIWKIDPERPQPVTGDKPDIWKIDPERINLSQPHQVTYWGKVLNVTPEQLAKAISIVGPELKDVVRYLNNAL